jgi:hypothetical protein
MLFLFVSTGLCSPASFTAPLTGYQLAAYQRLGINPTLKGLPAFGRQVTLWIIMNTIPLLFISKFVFFKFISSFG